jgi:hypothetical protein
MNYQTTLNSDMLHFLQDTTCNGERSSKIEAFVYLLDSVAENADNAAPNGQLDTTISELAEAWNWNRSNVRLFLTSLERLGVISMNRQGKLTTVSIAASFGEEKPTVRLLDDEEREWLRFIMGMVTLDSCLALFSDGVDSFSDKLEEIHDPKATGSRLRSLVSHLLLNRTCTLQDDSDVDEALRSLFVDDCKLDLVQFLSLLSLGGLAIIKDLSEEDSICELSEHVLRKLHTVLRYYAPWLEQPIVEGTPNRAE